MTQIGFYGLGRVAQALASLFSEQPNYSVVGASERIDAPWQHAKVSLSELKQSDYIFVLSKDTQLSSYLARLSGTSAVVIYCSGALDVAAETVDLKREQLIRAHPVYSFGELSNLTRNFPGTPVVISGDQGASAKVAALFDRVGAKPMQSETLDSASYHCGLVIASNYLVTLSAMAKSLLSEAGIAKVDTDYMVAHLMQNTLANISTSDEISALTGPIVRGDIATVEKHLEMLRSTMPSAIPSYCALGKRTLSLTTHDQALKDQLEGILNG